MRARTTMLAALLALLFAVTLGLSQTIAAAERSVNPADIAATRAYLEATLAYEQTVVANAAVSKASSESAADAIAGECPGVLANASFQQRGPMTGVRMPPSPRAIGEANRRERQLGKLQAELDEAPELAFYQPDLQAAVTLAEAVKSLSWSRPEVTRFVHQMVEERVHLLESKPPSVCADMRAWVASGYTTLSAGTKELRGVFGALILGAIAPAVLDHLMRAYEVPSEKALVGEARESIKQALRAEGDPYSKVGDLERTVGLQNGFFGSVERSRSIKPRSVAVEHRWERAMS
jgi:hypothetical protein